MADLLDLTMREAAAAVRRKEVSPVELARLSLGPCPWEELRMLLRRVLRRRELGRDRGLRVGDEALEWRGDGGRDR